MEILQGPKKSKNKESAKPNVEEENKAKQQKPQRPQKPKPEATEAGIAAEDDNEEGSSCLLMSATSICGFLSSFIY